MWKRGKTRVLQVKTGGKYVQNLKKTAAPSRFLANDLYAASSVCLYSTSEPDLQIVSLFWRVCVLFCFVLKLFWHFSMNDCDTTDAAEHLVSQKQVCSFRPLLVRNQVSSVPSFFLWTNLKTSRKRNSEDYRPCPVRCICEFAKVKGCFVWNSTAAVNLLRLPDIPSFIWGLGLSRKGKFQSALVSLITHQEANY